MADEGFKRKLTAILSADVFGYSRLMRDDEEATVRDIAARRALISDIVQQHHGRVVDSPGDNILAEFASVVDAVNGAIKIQQEISQSNADTPEDRRMEFRIGINLGDVIEEEERIYGDGVNIAARVEGLASAGGIAISGTVYEHIKEKLSLGYHYLGEQDVKNISEPVRVYRLLTEPDDAGKMIGEEKPKSSKPRSLAIGGLGLIIIIVGALIIWNNFLGVQIEPASIEKMAYPLPDKPSIAVLPFDNLSGNPEDEFIADGISESIITALSKTPKMLVISRNSTFTYKGKPVKIQKVAEDLSVQYVLEGSLQKSNDQLRINAQLIDAITGNHLWAEKYDRNLEDIFALQDDITMKIITALQVALSQGEQANITARGTENLEAYLKFLQGQQQFLRNNREGDAAAKKIAKEVISLEPTYPSGYYLLAQTHFRDVLMGVSKSPKKSIGLAIENAQKAISLDESLADAHALLGWLFTMDRQHEKGIAAAERGLELNPNSADAYLWAGYTLNFAGMCEEAVNVLEKSRRLSPLPRVDILFGLCIAYRDCGRYKEAILAAKDAIHREPNSLYSHTCLASCYGLLNRNDEAQAEVDEILRIYPKYTLEIMGKSAPYKNPEDRNRLIGAMRKAGLPDKPPLPLPDKPSIAVLAFDNLSGDPEQEYFSDGITEDIITALSKTPKMFVIARNSTFTYKGKPVKVQEVGRDLGVRYLLEGSFRRIEDKIRITAQLVDAKNGHHLWAEKYDRELKDLFALQDEITKEIITALQIKLTEGEQAKIYAKGTDNLEAYLRAMKANWLQSQPTKESVTQARQLAEEAIELDPRYAFPYKILGSYHMWAYWFKLSKNPKESYNRGLDLFRKAIELDDSLAIAHIALGYYLMQARQYDIALAEGERAFELEPNSADVINGYATILTMVGEYDQAISLFKDAIRLNPKPPTTYLRFYGVALRDSGRYEEAIVQAKKATEQEPKDLIAWIVLTSSYSLAERDEEAREAAKEILGISPKFSVELFEKRSPQKDRTVVKRYCDALRKSGLPE